MSNQHPITPPLELTKQWVKECVDETFDKVFTRIAQWGADQELEACCEWLCSNGVMYEYGDGSTEDLRTARRPKPPSLVEEAIASLSKIEDNNATYLDSSIVRRALERLQQLEDQQ